MIKNLPKKIVIDLDGKGDVEDISYFFADDAISEDRPWSKTEFKPSSPTRESLEKLEAHLVSSIQGYIAEQTIKPSGKTA